MDLFEIPLLEFDTYLSSINAPILGKLNDGITLSQNIQSLPELPLDVVAFYRWKNGTGHKPGYTLGQLWLFDTGIFFVI